MRKILFLSGTRADYGKIKPLMQRIDEHPDFELHIFVTGMHMLSKYGSTWMELEKDGFLNMYKFVNQNSNTKMDIALSNTVMGLSNYVEELKPDLIVIHGDRLEALAGAIVGAFNNIKVAHIEGGEVSGTIDESIRHAITKLAHIHLVSNEEAKNRIIQLGEPGENIFIIGSPDIDVMLSENLPTIENVKEKYGIPFDHYAILMYHPVTTEVTKLPENIQNVVAAVEESMQNYIVIYPNNDQGSEIIIEEYKKLEGNERFKLYPSMRFEYFLTLLKHAEFMIGNSSAGIRETGVYGISAIDLGIRQQGRYDLRSMTNLQHANEEKESILRAIENLKMADSRLHLEFGTGRSSEQFINILQSNQIWDAKIQKNFIDIEF